MNKEKTKALGFGTWSSRLIWPLEWFVSAPTLSLLGIKFSHSIVETVGRVWNDAFGSLNGILRENACRRFNIYQRVIFLKVKALSGTVYIAQSLYMSITYIILPNIDMASDICNTLAERCCAANQKIGGLKLAEDLLRC
ncbi:hypothetical protein OUZ56_026350 [Daphnia magna]|uniref:Uncharacterized protein n=1 Tax=Daphnia magna TaxID=35525 RepID=A0ABQ9ZLK8_9CRUS|nr:hypothetical protein OUZ56_026350 [Daphnia magna]